MSPEDFGDKFASRVTITKKGCWQWNGKLNNAGYASFGKTSGHRFAWERANGCKVPAKHDLDHLCRNKACVNPEHLEPVTRAENLRRGNHWAAGKFLWRGKWRLPVPRASHAVSNR